MFGRAVLITREEPKDTLRPPLSGRIRAMHNPGLKPWVCVGFRNNL